MRLQRQLLLLTLGPLAAAGVLAAALVWPPVDALLARNVEREAREQLDAQVLSMDAQLRAIQAALDAYASLPAVRDGTPESITALLYPLRSAVPGADIVNFIAADGTIVVPGRAPISARDRYYFPQLQRGEPVVTKAIVSISSNVPEVLVLRPVRNRRNEVTGAVGASLRLSDVLARIKSIKLSTPGFALLVDEDGRTLSSAPLSTLTASSALFRGADSVAAPPAWQAMLATLRTGNTDTTSVLLDEQRYLVYSRKLPALGWQMAIGFEESAMYAMRNTVALRALAAFLVLASCATLGAVLTRRRVVTPIADLAKAHAAVARGEFGARAALPAQNELAELATSFNRMADDLQAHQRQREHDEAMLRAVFEASTMAIAVYRATDRTYVRVNTAFAELFGRTPDEIVGRSAEELNVEEDVANRAALRAKLERDGVLQGERFRRVDASGRVRDFVFSAVPLQLDGERLLLFATVDVSETARLEAQLRQSQKLDVLGRLAGGVAHDFNNMLTGIMAASELIAMSLADEDALHDEVAVIRDSAGRAASLTKQLLMFSRSQPLSLQVFDAHQSVREALALAERTFDRRIELDIALMAPRAAIRGDAALLQTVIMNLLVNARDAMPDGGRLRIATSVPDASQLRIDVTDTGHGMPPDVAERIFEPFFTTKPAGMGTGLGLSVAFGIVREHGGDLQVRSVEGVGTTISVLLPLVPSDEQLTEIPTRSASVTPGRARVLVVDDEPMVRGTMARALRLAGHTVHVAEDGASAVALVVAGEPIDVVVLDLVMPGIDGVETLRRLRAHTPDLPAIICSGYGSEGAFAALASERDVQLLPKPFSVSDLTARVASVSRVAH
jgi:PAS domain S-box-containing protein